MPLCACGCGDNTVLDSARYLRGHCRRLSPVEYIVDSATGCWIWQRSLDEKGYGLAVIDGRTVRRAHIVFYERKYGTVPMGLELDHVVCSNRRCSNPDHVAPVRHVDNVRRGRVAKLDVKSVEEIRKLWLDGLITQRAIALKFEVHYSTISKIITGKNWQIV